MELDHIVPRADGGGDSIDNAIALCFDCHAEAHAYNPKHPRGRRFSPGELRAHRVQWLEICRTRPEVFTEPTRHLDVGPVQALVDELEFNLAIADFGEPGKASSPFSDDQFRRAIATGSLSLLEEELKQKIMLAYVAIGATNQKYAWAAAQAHPSQAIHASTEGQNAKKAIADAHDALVDYLTRD
jgi:hypothetical protein